MWVPYLYLQTIESITISNQVVCFLVNCCFQFHPPFTFKTCLLSFVSHCVMYSIFMKYVFTMFTRYNKNVEYFWDYFWFSCKMFVSWQFIKLKPNHFFHCIFLLKLFMKHKKSNYVFTLFLFVNVKYLNRSKTKWFQNYYWIDLGYVIF